MRMSITTFDRQLMYTTLIRSPLYTRKFFCGPCLLSLIDENNSTLDLYDQQRKKYIHKKILGVNGNIQEILILNNKFKSDIDYELLSTRY